MGHHSKIFAAFVNMSYKTAIFYHRVHHINTLALVDSIQHPVFIRCLPHLLLKEPRKMLGVLKT